MLTESVQLDTLGLKEIWGYVPGPLKLGSPSLPQFPQYIPNNGYTVYEVGPELAAEHVSD